MTKPSGNRDRQRRQLPAPTLEHSCLVEPIDPHTFVVRTFHPLNDTELHALQLYVEHVLFADVDAVTRLQQAQLDSALHEADPRYRGGRQ